VCRNIVDSIACTSSPSSLPLPSEDGGATVTTVAQHLDCRKISVVKRPFVFLYPAGIGNKQALVMLLTFTSTDRGCVPPMVGVQQGASKWCRGQNETGQQLFLKPHSKSAQGFQS
jgi:hypothetical protein